MLIGTALKHTQDLQALPNPAAEGHDKFSIGHYTRYASVTSYPPTLQDTDLPIRLTAHSNELDQISGHTITWYRFLRYSLSTLDYL